MVIVLAGALALGVAIGAALTSPGRRAANNTEPSDSFDLAVREERFDFGFIGSGTPALESRYELVFEQKLQWKESLQRKAATVRSGLISAWTQIAPYARTAWNWLTLNWESLLAFLSGLVSVFFPHSPAARTLAKLEELRLPVLKFA